MAGKREEKRKTLRAALIKAAVAQVTAGGSTALRARDLAKEAGCALGAIYYMFDDLDDLMFHVRAAIFLETVDWITTQITDAQPKDPMEHLLLLARAYHQYADENRNKWRAVFGSDNPGELAPKWYVDSLNQLMGQVAAPLKQLKPEAPADEIMLVARILFAGVHGLVMLNSQQKQQGSRVEAMQITFKTLIEAQVNHLISNNNSK